jgi:cytochrome P450/NADPH-cytochrome P450 reductase
MADKAFTAHVERSNATSERPLENEAKDIFETILSSDLPIGEKRPKRMANEVFNLLVAGSLTTSKTATIAVFHVLSNPDIYRRLQAELKEAILDPKSMPPVKTLQKLPLLVCYINPITI